MSSHLYLRPKWQGEGTSFTLLGRLRSSSTAMMLIASTALWLLCYQYLSIYSARDPTSYFFNTEKGYRRMYSKEREAEAHEYIARFNKSEVSQPAKSSIHPGLCVGIATIARPSEQYVIGTIGSLLEGLSKKDRDSIHLITFIAHTDPTAHPIYDQPWTQAVSDEVLTYDIPDADLQRLKLYEDDHHPRNKSMYDYGYLLRRCLQTGAPYVAIIEDDTIAREGWFKYGMAAVLEAANRAAAARWLYLRMFYTESLFGWNSEYWPTYMIVSILVCAAAYALINTVGTRVNVLRTRMARTDPMIFSLICVPAFIALYFMAGRVTVRPWKAGVNPMPRFGCCSQGFIFPQAIVPEIIERTDQAMDEDLYIDMLLERHAEKAGLLRFAQVPSLLQHVGSKSSKGGGYDEHAGEIFNFAFEEKPP